MNVDWARVFGFVFKVGAVAIAAAAVFVGVSDSVKAVRRREDISKRKHDEALECIKEVAEDYPEEVQKLEKSLPKPYKASAGEFLSEGLKATQLACSSIAGFSRNLHTIVNNLSTLFSGRDMSFRGDPMNNYYGPPGYDGGYQRSYSQTPYGTFESNQHNQHTFNPIRADIYNRGGLPFDEPLDYVSDTVDPYSADPWNKPGHDHWGSHGRLCEFRDSPDGNFNNYYFDEGRALYNKANPRPIGSSGLSDSPEVDRFMNLVKERQESLKSPALKKLEKIQELYGSDIFKNYMSDPNSISENSIKDYFSRKNPDLSDWQKPIPPYSMEVPKEFEEKCKIFDKIEERERIKRFKKARQEWIDYFVGSRRDYRRWFKEQFNKEVESEADYENHESLNVPPELQKDVYRIEEEERLKEKELKLLQPTTSTMFNSKTLNLTPSFNSPPPTPPNFIHSTKGDPQPFQKFEVKEEPELPSIEEEVITSPEPELKVEEKEEEILKEEPVIEEETTKEEKEEERENPILKNSRNLASFSLEEIFGKSVVEEAMKEEEKPEPKPEEEITFDEEKLLKEIEAQKEGKHSSEIIQKPEPISVEEQEKVKEILSKGIPQNFKEYIDSLEIPTFITSKRPRPEYLPENPMDFDLTVRDVALREFFFYSMDTREYWLIPKLRLKHYPIDPIYSVFFPKYPDFRLIFPNGLMDILPVRQEIEDHNSSSLPRLELTWDYFSKEFAELGRPNNGGPVYQKYRQGPPRNRSERRRLQALLDGNWVEMFYGKDHPDAFLRDPNNYPLDMGNGIILKNPLEINFCYSRELANEGLKADPYELEDFYAEPLCITRTFYGNPDMYFYGVLAWRFIRHTIWEGRGFGPTGLKRYNPDDDPQEDDGSDPFVDCC